MNTGLRLLGEDFKHLRFIDPSERLRLLAEGIAEQVYRAKDGSLSTDKTAGRSDGTIKIVTTPSEAQDLLNASLPSPCALTARDAIRNAAGLIDTAKRKLIYKMRKEGQLVSASIRCYGHDKSDKPKQAIVGNAVDRSMSKVEQWTAASDGNRAVTVVPGAVIGLTKRELDPREAFSL